MAKYVTVAWLIASITAFGMAEILIGPQNTEAEIGKPVELNCKGSLGDVEWQHLAIGATKTELVYNDGFVYDVYKERFNVTRIKSGYNVLKIRNVKATDAGTFTCLENSETPSRREAELIVFERFPSNESCAGKYTCKPVCNELELSCEVKAHGNHIPSMQWIDTEGGQLPSVQFVVNETIVWTVKLNSNPYVTTSYTFRLKYEGFPLISKYSWTYSTSVTKDMESAFEPQNQHEEVSPSLATSPLALYVFLTTSLAVNVLALIGGIYMYLMCKRRRAIQTEKAEPGFQIPVKLSENNTDAAQFLLSRPIEIDDTSAKDKFVPCTTENKDNPIHGLAVIDDEVFIMTRDGRVVEVFDLYTGTFKRYWPIGGLINPNDMVACPVKKRIFICDWKKVGEDKEIFCFDINGNQVDQTWRSEYEKGRISITKGSKIIVAENWHNTIKQYTSTGTLQKASKVGKDKIYLWHAVELDDGNFVASFSDVKHGHQGICIFDCEGQIKKSVTNLSDLCQVDSLLVPRSIAVDKNGSIYVSDLFNVGIIVLNRELEYQGFVDTTSDGYKLRGPLRICVHQYNKRSWLLVADSVKKNNRWRDGRVAVWNL